MALTLRIEENPEAQKALEKVQDVFEEKSATKAIYAALEYAARKEEHASEIKNYVNTIINTETKLKQCQKAIRSYVYADDRLREISMAIID